MKPPRITIGGMTLLVAIVALVVVALGRSWAESRVGLMTAAVIGLPASFVALRFGPDGWRSALLWLAMTAARLGLVAVRIAAVAGLAVGLATVTIRVVLASADAVTIAAFTVAALVLSRACVLAASGRESTRARAFGAGFALIGWPSLVVGLLPGWDDRVPVLATAEILHAAYPSAYMTEFPPPRPGRPSLARGPSRYLRFQRIGHCLFALGLGLIGGTLARSLEARRAGGDPGRSFSEALSSTPMPGTAAPV